MKDILQNLLADPSHYCTVGLSKRYTAFEIIQQVKKKQAILTSHDVKKCLIFRKEVDDFISDFIACLSLNIDIVLPHDGQKNTLKKAKIGTQAILGDSNESIDKKNTIDTPPTLLSTHTQNSDITFYTSGSTGEATPIIKKWSQLTLEASVLNSLWETRINNTTIVASVSHQHIYGLLFKVVLGLLYQRTIWNEVVLFEDHLQHIAEQYRAITFVSSPAFLKRLTYQQPHNAINLTFCSGGALTQKLALQAEQKLNTSCIRIFGSTETGGIAYQNSNTNAWQTLPTVSIKCLQERLWVRSAFCFQPFWYKTADKISLLNKQDNMQFILQGRIDNVVKIEEKRVSLIAVEKFLLQNPYVRSTKVIPFTKKRQLLAAAIVLTSEGNETLQAVGKKKFDNQLKTYCKDFLELATIPKIYRYVTNLPENTQGKITFANLQALFAKKP